MKYVLICIFLGAVAARPQDAAPPAAATAAPAPHTPSNVSFVKNDVKPLDGQGNYQYDIELSDGTKFAQMGHTQAPEMGSTDSILVIQGSYSYVSPEGKTISITYTADDKGFVAMGDAIPQAGNSTAPAAPPAAAAAAPPATAAAAAPPAAAAAAPPAAADASAGAAPPAAATAPPAAA